LSYEILVEIKRHVLENYSDALLREPIIIRRRLRIYLIDGTFIDVRYANLYEYSLHWQGKNKLIRVDTAPHYPQLSSYPRHLHLFTENNVIEDEVTSIGANPVDNVRSFLEFVFRKGKDP